MIDKKRTELEQFIREQTIGPGFAKFRFRDLNHNGTTSVQPVTLDNEIIDTNPGNVYSTGILFPVDDTRGSTITEPAAQSDPGLTNESNAEGLPGATPEEDNEPEEESLLDQQSLNQMYPNSMALTVCLHKDMIVDKGLKIFVHGRYYHKLNLVSGNERVGLLLEQERSVFDKFMSDLPNEDIIRTRVSIETIDDSTYIFLPGGSLSIIGMKTRVYELRRRYYDELRADLPDLQHNPGSLEALKEHLFQQLQREVLPGSKLGQLMLAILARIESVEDTLLHITDLINIHEASGYGAWRSETFSIELQHTPPEVTRSKQIYSYKNHPELTDLFRHNYRTGRSASLAVNLQYSKYAGKEENRIYLKIQLLNTSTHFSDADTRNGRNYFSLASEEVNKRCFFGVGIKVESEHLLPYRSFTSAEREVSDEDAINQYIYRQFEDYGRGHGCSVKWRVNESIKIVATEYIPYCDTPDVDPVPRYRDRFEYSDSEQAYVAAPVFRDTSFMRFKWLSTLSSATDKEIIEGLRSMVNAYTQWVNEQVDQNNITIAGQIQSNCRQDQQRMYKNIEHLVENSDHLKCFRLMNTAMFMQIWHKEKKAGIKDIMADPAFDAFNEDFYGKKADDKLYKSNVHAAWRPFQLAFILLNIDGIFQRNDDKDWTIRNQWVDLVWFPTGGGKTEAYLGLIAMTIINRRMTYGARGGGVAAIMRYTLRLLTAQQFQRATLLIMALELMRRWDPSLLGAEPIYIGMYVGSGSLPNKLTEGEGNLLDEFNKLKKAQQEKKKITTKIPFTECPWCGQKLDLVNYEHVTEKKRVFQYGRILLSCSDKQKKCSFFDEALAFRPNDRFQGPIPVSLCDEEIYQHPPALLFGTVDKFAQLAHKVSDKVDKMNNDSRRLFGRGKWEAGKPSDGYITPDLIIQDELHLMMGPLGSAVALFESAIDQLCTRQENGLTIRPKVISSTATTRNTQLQIMALFDRKVNLFPKTGIQCDDSFFAFYKRTGSDDLGNGRTYLSKRRYLGILPTGRTQMWMQLRLAAILFTHRAIFELQELKGHSPTDIAAYNSEFIRTMDYYHTVLAYFNSLREVGKTESQIFTYLIKETRRVFNKALRPAKLMQCFYSYATSFRNGELTGRLNGEQIVEQMQKASMPWSPMMRLAHIDLDNSTQTVRGTTPPDLVIATNMISVGIDISRFNSMIINCMPRNIAEYIQASSRVARETKGLVITVHHPFRSRDLSHYERFIDFHEKMYSYVEPISITPFTHKALVRYLPLYMATMIRHLTTGYMDRETANVLLTEQMKHAILGQLIAYFKIREAKMRRDGTIEKALKQILTNDNLTDINSLLDSALDAWRTAFQKADKKGDALVFNNKWTGRGSNQQQLYVDMDEFEENVHSELWRIPQSLRVVDPEAIIHINQK